MTQPQSPYNKELLRKRMNEVLDQFLQVIDRLSEEQMTARTDATGWNVRDHLTHLAAWADGIAALIRRENRWAAMGLEMDEPDYDILNAQLVERSRSLSPGQARNWLVKAHQRVVEAMEELEESRLSEPYGKFVPPFTGDWGYPIAEYFLGNTEDHYDQHTPWLLRIVDS